MDNLEGLLDKLNKEQLEAVTYIDGPVMVFAGAGTGKTRALTARIAYMIKEKNIIPYNILAITFTKKATNEMRERIATIIGDQAKYINMSTIHSLCARLLRGGIDVLGYTKDFEILDDEDALKVLGEVYKEENIDRKYFPPKTLLNMFGYYKLREGYKLFSIHERIYNAYQKYLKEHNLLDFNDLLVLTKEMLTKDTKYLAYLREKYQYILVDEFQDTNPIQYAIIKMLTGEKQNLFVVGDDDQSIYSFTGATVDNMYLFLDDYPYCKKVILDQNYRSSNMILRGANSVINNNTNREKKSLKGQTEGTFSDVIINDFYYFEDEARFVSSEIKNLIKKGYEYSDIGIIYRNNVISRNFELSFIENHIPYTVYGGPSYLKRREIKDIITYLKFIINPDNVNHFRRIINQPSRGIGEKTINKVLETKLFQNVDLFEAITIVHNTSPSAKTKALIEFKEMIEDFIQQINTQSLKEFYEYLLDKTGYLEMAKIEDEDNETNRCGNLEEFKSVLLKIESNFLDEEYTNIQKLQSSFDEIILDESMSNDNNTKGVVLSTVHSVKGLEFKIVFVVALEEGIFPTLREDTNVEEERRTAYVAFTRAKEKIYLTCSSRRLIYGKVVVNKKSRFLTEYISNPEWREHFKESEQKETKDLGEIHVGERLHHKLFGAGIVIAVDDMTAQILFEKDNSLRKILKNHPGIIRGE